MELRANQLFRCPACKKENTFDKDVIYKEISREEGLTHYQIICTECGFSFEDPEYYYLEVKTADDFLVEKLEKYFPDAKRNREIDNWEIDNQKTDE